jgi:uncharacterized protein
VTTKANKTGDDLRIRVSQLSSGIHEYHLTGDPAGIGLDDRFAGPVKVDALLDKAPGQLYLKVVVNCSGKFPCDRCVEEYVQDLSSGYTVLYVYDEVQPGKQIADDVQVISPDTTHVDLTSDVRELVTLAVPLKLLCREDCRGLCPHCGGNLNVRVCDCKENVIDPRWQGLQGLLKN